MGDSESPWIPVYVLRRRARGSIIEEPGWKTISMSFDLEKIKAQYDQQPERPGWDIIELSVPKDGLVGGHETLLYGKGWEGYA